MKTVKIERYTASYRRTVNGAWVGNGGETDHYEVPEDRALAYVRGGGLSSSCVIEWPDGHREYFRHDSSNTLTGPGDSRLMPEAERAPRGLWFVGYAPSSPERGYEINRSRVYYTDPKGETQSRGVSV